MYSVDYCVDAGSAGACRVVTESLGDRLVQARTEKAIRAADLARKLGVSPVTVYRWEKKGVVPESETLVRIADLLEVDARWLLYGESRLERDDDPFVRRPNLARFVARFSEKYSPATLKALEVLAFDGGREPSLGDYLDAAEEYEQRVVAK